MYITFVVIPTLIDNQDEIVPLTELHINQIGEIMAATLPSYFSDNQCCDILDYVIDCEYNSSFEYYITINYSKFFNAVKKWGISPSIGNLVDALYHEFYTSVPIQTLKYGLCNMHLAIGEMTLS